MTGYLAYSLAGHDKGKIYFIIKEETDCVWLADGKDRPLENPKKKNKKHIQIIKKELSGAIAGEQLKSGCEPQSITNETIKRTIKLFNKDIQEVK